MDVTEALTKLTAKIQTWIDASIVMLPNLLVAILVVVLFHLISRLVERVVRSLLNRTHTAARDLLATLARFLVLGAGVVVALGVLELDGAVTSLLAGAGIIGIALGFAFQDLGENLISGIGLNLRKPLTQGDVVETGGEVGIVKKIELRTTQLTTFDGDIVILPNKELFQGKVKIHAVDKVRRIELTAGVSYAEDLEKVKSIAIEAVRGAPRCIGDRPVELFYKSFGESSIDFELRFWIEYKRFVDYLDARSDAIMRIKRAFDENDIVIPFPIRTLDFGIKGGKALAEMLPSADVQSGPTNGGKRQQESATRAEHTGSGRMIRPGRARRPKKNMVTG